MYPFDNGYTLIFHLLQDPFVKRQPAQFFGEEGDITRHRKTISHNYQFKHHNKIDRDKIPQKDEISMTGVYLAQAELSQNKLVQLSLPTGYFALTKIIW